MPILNPLRGPSWRLLGGDALLFSDLPLLPFQYEQIKLKISFYTKIRGEIKEILQLDHTSVEVDVTKNSKFAEALALNRNRVILITHGFHCGSDEDWVTKMRNALLSVEPQIVGTVDWKGGAHYSGFGSVDIFMTPNPYKIAASNCLIAGEWVGEIGKWLHKLIQKHGGGYLWGIGHSLGAHLMGVAGRGGTNGRSVVGRYYLINENVNLQFL